MQGPRDTKPDDTSSRDEQLESHDFCKDGKRKYSQIDYDVRQQLLQIIDKGQLSIKTASEQLGINYSTAKNIVRIYRREKRVHKLPKRVSKALEIVLGSWKKPIRKLPRFVAKKCKLFAEQRLGLANKELAGSELSRLSQNTDHSKCSLSGFSETLEEKPRFNFLVYRHQILESMIHKRPECTVWSCKTTELALPWPIHLKNSRPTTS